HLLVIRAGLHHDVLAGGRRRHGGLDARVARRVTAARRIGGIDVAESRLGARRTRPDQAGQQTDNRQPAPTSHRVSFPLIAVAVSLYGAVTVPARPAAGAPEAPVASDRSIFRMSPSASYVLTATSPCCVPTALRRLRSS